MSFLSTVHENPLPYAGSLDLRALDTIELVVIHCTELPDLPMAREYGEHIHYPESGTGNSGHFYIEQCGHIEQWVPLDRVAHHVRNFNRNSLGIELVNPGRYPHWLDSRSQDMKAPYPPEQVRALVSLLLALIHELPTLSLISAHSALDTTRVKATDNEAVWVQRKLDPGPMFPWSDVLSEVSLHWFEPATD